MNEPYRLDPALPAILTTIAERAACQAGALVHDGRPDEVEVTSTKSSPQDVVTAMDLASEDCLRAVLHQARPDDGILGEERGYEPGTSGVTWVIDPIDGTVNYLYGLAGYAVLVAAVASPGVPDPATWTVLASCVRAPALGHTWTATLGGGAFRDGRRLAVREAPQLGGCLLGTGFGYRREVRELQGQVVARLLPQVRDLRRMGAAGLDLCAVADGTLDLFYEHGLQPWDLAAGSLVVTEAGAQVSGLHGERAGPAMTVAGHAGRIGELIAELEQAGADEPV
ncbi:MAG: inositol monophosphatase [Micrococcales bacterium]|nr:inositol monophosphatase [Micrococcales bacterium]MCL2668074.1 inositol monophosphatase [Micrococcales bacterium]